MKTIEFSFNWNLKLNCRSFSTVRIENPSKYQLNEEYRVLLKQAKNKPPIDFGIARLKYIHYFWFSSTTPGISFLDANLDVKDFQKLLLQMYSKSGIDFNKTRLSFLVFQYIPIKEPERAQI